LIIKELLTKWGFSVDSSEVKKGDEAMRKMKSTLVDLTKVVLSFAAVWAQVAPAMNLEANLKNTLTLTDDVGTAFEKLNKDMTKSALNLSQELGMSAADIANSYYNVLSAGAKALSPEFNSLSQTGIKMAKTIGISASESIDRITDTLGSFSLKITEANRVADVFFRTSFLVATTVPQLTQAMTDAAPAAKKMKISLEATSAVLAALAKAGTKGSRAGTAFRQIVLKLAGPVDAGKKALKTLNTEVFNLDGTMRPLTDVFRDMQKGLKNLTQQQGVVALKAIAGEEAFSKLAAILSMNIDLVDDWTKILKKAEGSLDIAFNKKMSSATEQSKKFFNSIRNMAILMGSPFLSPIARLAKELNKIASSLIRFADQHPVIIRLTGLISILTFSVIGLSAALTTGITVWKLFGNAALIAQIKSSIMIAGIVALVVGGVALILLALEDFSSFVQGKDSVTGLIVEAFEDMWANLKLIWMGVKAGLSEWWSGLISDVSQASEDIKNSFLNTFSFIGGLFVKTIDPLLEKFDNMIDGWLQSMIEAKDSLVSKFFLPILGFIQKMAEAFDKSFIGRALSFVQDKILGDEEDGGEPGGGGFLSDAAQSLAGLFDMTPETSPIAAINRNTTVNQEVTVNTNISVPEGTQPEQVASAVKEGVSDALSRILKQTGRATEPLVIY